MENMYLDFNVGSEIYGIKIKHVLQIIGMQKITLVPDMPPDMKGIISMRGNVIPVISVHLRFGKAEEAYADLTCIIVVQAGGKEIGLIVDTIQETISIDSESISQLSSVGTDTENSYIMGIGKHPNNRISILLDVKKMFSNY